MGYVLKQVKPGEGSNSIKPKKGQTVKVHYTGTLPNGKTFDCSRERGKPFTFVVGKGDVIRGLDEGIKEMSVGEKAVLSCTPDYGYGKRGSPGVIPGDTPLTFDLELIEITNN